ncbi:unnamed protein product [Albugo candida]|uniref:Uncharacterized protein n=1 Tax=Albugo candida TaxID=65357 RepID=A0A024FWB5_9STRA|nr:unnamed protein product [Albugo candida]|eukprot:CCI11443.1 unnamed protein product [Albugo candida]
MRKLSASSLDKISAQFVVLPIMLNPAQSILRSRYCILPCAIKHYNSLVTNRIANMQVLYYTNSKLSILACSRADRHLLLASNSAQFGLTATLYFPENTNGTSEQVGSGREPHQEVSGLRCKIFRSEQPHNDEQRKFASNIWSSIEKLRIFFQSNTQTELSIS